MFFLGLLIIPTAPGALSTPAAIALGIWLVGGFILYFKVRPVYEKSTLDISVIDDPVVCDDTV